jgi:hypothetical protein
VTLEGTLLAYSPHPGYGCGTLYVHQVAKYRVNKVLSGKFASEEIIVDHPACGGNVFKSIPVGSHLRMTVRVWPKYLSVWRHPRIREAAEKPKLFYVAENHPVLIRAGQ